MKLDWYQCTIRDKPGRVLSSLERLGQTIRANPKVGKMYRYTHGFEVVDQQGNVIAKAAHGGPNGEDQVHAWATSDDAVPFASMVREKWPQQHLVTRVDSCQDFIDASAFSALTRCARRVAKSHRMRYPRLEDELNPEAGRTQYIGSPSSSYRGRIYEKGWQIWNEWCQKSGVQPEAGTVAMEVPGVGKAVNPADWVRAELQLRPEGEEARQRAAMASPEELWTFTKWSSEFAREALALDLERYYIRTRKEPADEQALRWMCRQYGHMLHRLQRELGDWSCVGLQIGDVIAGIEAEKARY